MWGRIAAMAAAAALAACANLAPAGRNAERAPPPPTSAEASERQPPTSVEVQPQTTAAPVAAPEVAAPQPAPSQRSSGGEIIVPGQVERQVPPPGGDPRSTAERMEDIRAWDQCVMQVQSAFESDPMRPQLQSPEEYCRQSLGMADRLSVPQSRLERRR